MYLYVANRYPRSVLPPSLQNRPNSTGTSSRRQPSIGSQRGSGAYDLSNLGHNLPKLRTMDVDVENARASLSARSSLSSSIKIPGGLLFSGSDGGGQRPGTSKYGLLKPLSPHNSKMM